MLGGGLLQGDAFSVYEVVRNSAAFCRINPVVHVFFPSPKKSATPKKSAGMFSIISKGGLVYHIIAS